MNDKSKQPKQPQPPDVEGISTVTVYVPIGLDRLPADKKKAARYYLGYQLGIQWRDN